LQLCTDSLSNDVIILCLKTMPAWRGVLCCCRRSDGAECGDHVWSSISSTW